MGREYRRLTMVRFVKERDLLTTRGKLKQYFIRTALLSS